MDLNGQFPESVNHTSILKVPLHNHSIFFQVIEHASAALAALRMVGYATWQRLRPKSLISRRASDAIAGPISIWRLVSCKLNLKSAIRSNESQIEWSRQNSTPQARLANAGTAIVKGLPEAEAYGDRDPGNRTVEVSAKANPHESLYEKSDAAVCPKVAQPLSTRFLQTTDLPRWLGHSTQRSIDYRPCAPIEQADQLRFGLVPIIHLISAALFGIALFVGFARWMYAVRPLEQLRIQMAGSPHASVLARSEGSSSVRLAQAPTVQSKTEPRLSSAAEPRTSGVYAVINEHLIELEQLPISVPDAHTIISAEITDPSSVVVHSGRLAFVIFDRNLISNAPRTAVVRIIAQIAHGSKNVFAKTRSRQQVSWRIRGNSYEFQVSALNGERMALVIEPDRKFFFPPGRYALILAGRAYDFTVSGRITTPEHCLEEILRTARGAVFSECTGL